MAEEQDDLDRRVSMLTTLHYVNQTQRMGTISESTGRASMFLTSVSMALVALGFIAQATELSDAFFAFAFALIAVLLLIGLSTFMRTVQLGAEDGTLAAGNERIRRFYAETAPGVERWFHAPLAKDDDLGDMAVTVKSRGQLFMTASSMIAAVNAALAGVAAALALSRAANTGLMPAVLGGVLTFTLAFALQLWLSRGMWNRVQEAMADAGRDANGHQSSRSP